MAGLLDFLGSLGGPGGLLGGMQQQNVAGPQDMAQQPGALSGIMSGLSGAIGSTGQPAPNIPGGPTQGTGFLGGLQGALQQIADPEGKQRQASLAHYLAMEHLKLQQQHGGLQEREFGLKQQHGNIEERKMTLMEKSAVDKPTFGHVGVDRNGNPLYGFINAAQQKATPYIPGGGAGIGEPSSDLTGQAFLDSLDTGRAAQVKAIVEGRMQPPGSFALKSPQIQGLLRDVGQYEPGFDMTKWNARHATAKDFASGKAANNVTSLNTVVGHLGDLMEKSDALGNVSGVPLMNQTVNELKNVYTRRSGDEAVTNFELARNAVADEMAKVFRSSGMSDSEIRQWKENLSSSFSPEQMRGAVKTAIGLMDSRLGALADQRSRGMDTQLEPRALLNQKSVDTLRRLESWSTGGPAKAVPAKDQGRAPGAGQFKILKVE